MTTISSLVRSRDAHADACGEPRLGHAELARELSAELGRAVSRHAVESARRECRGPVRGRPRKPGSQQLPSALDERVIALSRSAERPYHEVLAELVELGLRRRRRR